MIEHRLFGPPGTGKTTYLARQIERAVEKHGPDSVMVASYTKAAAAELNRRNLPIPKEAMGTLHALCYRALNRPEIAETHIDEFNAENPGFALSNIKTGMDEMAVDAQYGTDADMYFAEYNLFRAKMLPLHTMSKPAIQFLKVWERFKEKHDYTDFTDMIHFVLAMKEPPPGKPIIGIYDEAQDFNALQMKLVRHWMQYQEYIIIGGDDDQTIYEWSGSSPECFLYPEVPKEQKHILKQSYRLPRAIQELSNRWIKQVRNREPKEFAPRPEQGEIRYLDRANYQKPVQAIEEALRYAENGKTVMFLASCSYMLKTLIASLRYLGLSFHNPYRQSRGDWNPMGTFGKGAANRVSTRDRLVSFLNPGIDFEGRPLWEIHDLVKWTDMIKTRGILKRGAKEHIANAAEGIQFYDFGNLMGFYSSIFEPAGLEIAMKRDLNWFWEHSKAEKKKALDYPIAVYKKLGLKALTEKPKLMVGTVHSVKGGEADCVVLFPDLSVAAMAGWMKGGEGKDAVVRTFYVGMTRAKESLLVCQPSTGMTVTLQ